MTRRAANMFVVGQCHDGTDVAVYKASEDDYNDEVLTLAEAESLAAESARERGCRFFVFADTTAEVAYAMTLRDMEGLLRQISTDLWVMTVDNPETATRASEAAGMTPRRRELRNIQRMVEGAVASIEDLINDTSEEI